MKPEEIFSDINRPDKSAVSADMMAKLGIVRYYAERIKYWVESLPRVPEWETMAEDEIKNAITELKDVERRLNEALALYHTKPIGE